MVVGRRLERPVVHGVLMGAVARGAVHMLFFPVSSSALTSSADTPIYYLGHVLNLAGGAVGAGGETRARPSGVPRCRTSPPTR